MVFRSSEFRVSPQIGTCVQFADDLWKIRVVDDHSAAAAASVILEDMQQLDSSIGSRSYLQNADKLVIVPMLRRPSEHRVLTQLLPQYRVQHEHRHLGTLFSGLMNEASEVSERIRCVNRGWAELRGLWTAHVPWRVKLMAFRTRCLSAAYSGLTGVAVTPRQLRRLDAALVGKLRFLLAIGRGPRPEGPHCAQLDEEVWRRCRLCPSEVELAVQRLRWLQRTLEAPDVHAQTLMGWFGDLGIGGPRTLDDSGRPS